MCWRCWDQTEILSTKGPSKDKGKQVAEEASFVLIFICRTKKQFKKYIAYGKKKMGLFQFLHKALYIQDPGDGDWGKETYPKIL